MNAGSELFLGKAALFEEFLEQRVVTLRNMLDQFLMKLRDAFLPLPCRRFFRVSPAPSRVVRDNLAAHYIQHFVKSRARVQRHIQRKNSVLAVMSPRILQDR